MNRAPSSTARHPGGPIRLDEDWQTARYRSRFAGGIAVEPFEVALVRYLDERVVDPPALGALELAAAAT